MPIRPERLVAIEGGVYVTPVRYPGTSPGSPACCTQVQTVGAHGALKLWQKRVNFQSLSIYSKVPGVCVYTATLT